MKIRCVWEHNGDDSLLHAVDFAGAFTRGPSLAAAVGKMPGEIQSYLRWRDGAAPESAEPFDMEVVQQKSSTLTISDADSDVLFEEERLPLEMAEYTALKALALKSARDFLSLYEAVPNKNASCLSARPTFYGQIPRTAAEMYEHTKNVNSYYFGEIDVPADNGGDILACRERGFALLEEQPHFLEGKACVGSYGEEWSLRKVLRRFLWHDRIHARAMYRMAVRTFGADSIPNVFCFQA